MKKYVKIIILSNTNQTDKMFSYLVEKDFDIISHIGCRVIVPFGKKDIIGIIISEDINIDLKLKYKPIKKVIDNTPLITKELLDIATYLVEKTFCNYTQAFKTVLPPSLQTKIKINEKYLPKKEKFIRLKIKKESITLPANAIVQKQIINELVENKWKRVNDFELKNKKSIETLLNKDILELKEEYYFKNTMNFDLYKKDKLTNDQSNIYNTILNEKSNKNFLLKGVTGSGKTEIYLHLVEYIVSIGKDAIILVPEISLTPQTIERFAGRFKNQIAILHSKLSDGERFAEWNKILNGDVKIVVGARSAIFAPFKNLGIIIIDEEQEDSYRSEQSPKYDARNIAELRSLKNNSILIFGTATPSINTYKKTIDGKIKLLELQNRIHNNTMPKVEVINMKNELKNGNKTMFSNSLMTNIEESLKQNKQIILFLNKRGHSSFVFCRSCGYVEKCEKCDVSLVFHSKTNRLVCHYCGLTKKNPKICPNCNSLFISYFGIGTEQVEEFTKKLFPNSRICRMDFDTTRNKSSYKEIYNKMKNNEIDILIGTQMIAKGLDFKNVNLVGILSADITLNLPTYTANEKTFQLITQVSGRAGRSKEKGKVILQTYQPDNFVIKSAKNYNYQNFYDLESKIRKYFKYPPFQNLLVLTCSSKNIMSAKEALIYIKQEIINDECIYKEIDIIGPNEKQIFKLNNTFRYQLIIKYNNKNFNINKRIFEVKEACIKKHKNSNITMDINPNFIK